MRKTGSILENYAWWVRLNLMFGALVPNWPGELYWAMRKPVHAALPQAQADDDAARSRAGDAPGD